MGMGAIRGSTMTVIVAIALTAAMVASGCGGDDASSANEDGQGGSHQEFVKLANAACKERAKNVQKRGSQVFAKYGKTGEGQIFQKTLINEVIIPEFQGEVRDLQKLEVPAEDQSGLNEFYAAIKRMVKQLEVNPAANSFYPYKEAEAVADKLGLTECGRPS